MKKLLAVLSIALLVVGAVTIFSMAEDTSAPGPSAPTAPAQTASPSAVGSGAVYYLNFKPEQSQQWQALAKTYTEQTGVPVTVVTAASGTYENTLRSELEKAAAPTLFQVNGPVGLKTWRDYCLDLRDTALYRNLKSDDFALIEDGQVLGVAYVIETYGLIYNRTLLDKYMAMDGAVVQSADQINNFETLKAVAEDIHARAAELGFDAFTSSGMDGSSSWRFSGHLANMPLYYEFRDDGITSQPATIKGTYLDNFKQIWDLYINNSATDPSQLASATGDQALAEFGEGKAVFYQNGTWEYANLTGEKFGMDPADLVMIPIYIGVEGEEDAGLACGTENCWAVNSQASEADQKATLDFLYWVVTSDEGTTMMAEQFGPIPFKAAKASDNVFFNDANRYIAEGKYVVSWAFNYTPNVDTWRAAVVAAMTQYSAGGSWDDVVTAFVQGWATQYANQ